MKYDTIYNSNCRLVLASGREITLDTLVQRRTYAGLMLGTPSNENNDDLISWSIEYARRLPDAIGEPYVISPPRRNYRVTPGDMKWVVDSQADCPVEARRISEWLPEIYAIGVFHSISPARDKNRDLSALTIIWYQPDFGLDADSMKPISLIDWDFVATDQDW